MLPNAGEGRGLLVGKPEKWVLGVALGALLCLVSGCSSSSSQPGSTATSSSTDTPTASASASVAITPATSPTADPNIPAEARPATMDGAQKFAAFWVAQFNLALRTADPAPIAALSTAECVACQGFVSDADELRQKGEHVERDLWAVNDAYLDKFDNVASAVVVVTIRQNPVTRVDNNGAVVVQYKPRTEDVALTLQHTGSGWVVTKLQVVK